MTTITAKFMSDADIEEYTGGAVKASTLRWWRHTGRGGPRWFRMGARKILYKTTDVDEWLEKQYDGGAA